MAKKTEKQGGVTQSSSNQAKPEEAGVVSKEQLSSENAESTVISNKQKDSKMVMPKSSSAPTTTGTTKSNGGATSTLAAGEGDNSSGDDNRLKSALKKYTPQHTNTNRAKFGKANPKRDILIFMAIIGFLFLCSWEFGDSGNPNKDNNKSNTLSQIKRMRIQLAKQLERESSQIVERYDCNLFLGRSSIPGAGLGIFAGKNYSQGEFLMHTGLRVPVSLDPIEEDAYGYMDTMMFLLKHHGIEYNTAELGDFHHPMWGFDSVYSPEDGRDEAETAARGHSLIATTRIEAGAELFLTPGIHPHNGIIGRETHVFDSLPQNDDYDLADEIAKDMVVQFKAKNLVKKFKKQRSQEIGYGLRAVNKAVARFNPRVAALLPTMASHLSEYHTANATTRVLAMNKFSYKGLAGSGGGMCLDDIEWKFSSTTPPTTGTLVSTRRIENGTAAFPVPLYILQKKNEEQGTCSALERDDCPSLELSDGGASASNCMRGEGSSLVFCPLLVGSIRTIPFPLDEADETPNIEFQWSERNIDNERIRLYSADAIAKDYATKLSWDAIALRDIEPGEELIAAVKMDPSTGARTLTGKLVAKKWKDLDQIAEDAE